jgi:hypothetical protein
MSKSSTTRGPYYRWLKAKGKIDLSPLPSSVHELIEKSPAKCLPVAVIHQELKSDTDAKKTAVWIALRGLCEKGLLEAVPIGSEVLAQSGLPTRGPSTRGMAAGAQAPSAAAIDWECPATASISLDNKILVFLQSEAVARVNANPDLSVSDIWFGLADIQKGVDPTIPAGRYIAMLKLTLGACVRVRVSAEGDSFQAATV